MKLNPMNMDELCGQEWVEMRLSDAIQCMGFSSQPMPVRVSRIQPKVCETALSRKDLDSMPHRWDSAD